MKRIFLIDRAAVPLLFLTSTCAGLAQPRLDIQSGVAVSWPTITNNTYQPQWSPSSSGPWSLLGGSLPGDGTTNSLYDPVPIGTRHYRTLEIVPGSPAASSIPTNGGFESGSGAAANNWAVTTAAGGPVYAVRTNNNPRSGSFNLEVHLASTGAGPVVEFAQSGVPVAGGTSFPFTFYSSALTGSAGYNAQWRIVWNAGGDTGYVGFSPGNNAYGLTSNSVSAPASATSATLYFHFAGAAITNQSATIDIDDIAFNSGSGSGSPGATNILAAASQAIAKISWPTTYGVQYQPQIITNLAGGTWTNIFPPILGDGTIRAIMVPMTPDRAFIRVQSPRIEPDTNAGILALFDASTPLEPPTTVVTSNALITYVADRARDRHAREANFQLYDHYLSWYWEQRVANIEIIDHVAQGGTDITFNYTTQDQLNPAEFRTFFRGITTVAEYHNNQQATLVGTNASATPGEIDYHYTASVSSKLPENRPLQLGDRVEIEISQFLLAPRHGRNNYYGTAILYIVGQGIVPWQEGVTNDPPQSNGAIDSYPLPTNAWLGGLTTLPYQYSDEPVHRFKQTAGNISPTNGLPFMLGRRLHHTDFGDGTHSEPDNPIYTEQIGKLGPKFINRSCVSCHVNNGRALPPALGAPMLQTVVKVGTDANGTPDPTLGSVLQPQSISGPAEGGATIASYTTTGGQYGDGTPYSLQKPNYAFQGTTPAYFSVRLAPQLVGLGLLEAVSESAITIQADPGDADLDGISGRVQTVIDPQTGQQRLGRFNYKGGKARISHQVAGAFNADMGVTTSVFPILDGETTGGSPELSDDDLDKLTRYIALLGVSARRDLTNAQALQGEQLFASANCVKCHTPTLATSPYHPMTELRNQTIHPYTDMLLHDMGPDLADNMGEGNATGSEWRTSPLWNIGLTAGVSGGEAYLHDGRARSLEEAILWHGGEAEAAEEAFRTMSAADRAALIRFLKSL